MNTVTEINENLHRIGAAQRYLADLQTSYEAFMEGFKEEWAERMRPTKELIERLDKQTIALMKDNKEYLFPDGMDQVTLEHGILLHGHGEHVAIPRNAIARCEAEGYLDAVKIAKSIDRAVVEKWPDEKLFMIGAERKPIEKFEYELKQGSGFGVQGSDKNRKGKE